MDNNKLFFEFLRKNNLLEKYQRILEVLNKPSDSIARYSAENIYLLDNLVSQKDLANFGIKGEMGTLTKDGIVLPKQILTTYKIKERQVPKVTDFDLIMGNGISNTSFIASNFPQDKLFGFCTDTTDPSLHLRMTRASFLLDEYNQSKNPGYDLVATEEKGKVYCLIKKTE